MARTRTKSAGRRAERANSHILGRSEDGLELLLGRLAELASHSSGREEDVVRWTDHTGQDEARSVMGPAGGRAGREMVDSELTVDDLDEGDRLVLLPLLELQDRNKTGKDTRSVGFREQRRRIKVA